MKSKSVKLLVSIAGILVYSLFYIATTKKDHCYSSGFTYQKDSIIYAHLSKQPGYLYHSLDGKNCDTLRVQIKDSVFNYAVLGDSACVAAKKAEVIIKGTVLVKWNLSVGKLDTLIIRACN
ncbi:MAG: hypothetical protein QM725_04930 [Lacibacter sp.]